MLALSGNQLSGSLPTELGNLTNLTLLSLGDNQLTGAMPPELGNLTNLTRLFLNDSQVTGTLPQSLTGLSMLSTFFFHDTNLCEPLNEAFQTWLQGIANLQSTGCTNVATEERPDLPVAFVLEANYPNPFNPATRIRYAHPEVAPVRLSVYDVQGRLVRVLAQGVREAGTHKLVFEAGGLPSGVYFYRLEAGTFRAMRSMLLLR